MIMMMTMKRISMIMIRYWSVRGGSFGADDDVDDENNDITIDKTMTMKRILMIMIRYRSARGAHPGLTPSPGLEMHCSAISFTQQPALASSSSSSLQISHSSWRNGCQLRGNVRIATDIVCSPASPTPHPPNPTINFLDTRKIQNKTPPKTIEWHVLFNSSQMASLTIIPIITSSNAEDDRDWHFITP